MSSEEQALPVSLERLEIVSRVQNEDSIKIAMNPFNRKRFSAMNPPTKNAQKPFQMRTTRFKKSHSKSLVLKEPVLKLIVDCVSTNKKDPDTVCNSDCNCNEIKASPVESTKVFGDSSSSSQNFKSLLSGCAELTLKPTPKQHAQKTFRHARHKNVYSENKTLSYNSQISKPPELQSSCSQQALMNEPCDITIDELASYFETFVHIPKKMSSMAEMMYI